MADTGHGEGHAHDGSKDDAEQHSVGGSDARSDQGTCGRQRKARGSARATYYRRSIVAGKYRSRVLRGSVDTDSGAPYQPAMRICGLILKMCVLAAIVMASPAYSAAPRPSEVESVTAQPVPARAHAMVDGIAGAQVPCLAGHCIDDMSVTPDCAAGFGHCGPAFAAILPDLPSFWPPSADVPTAVHAQWRDAQRASDPPPPRTSPRTV